MKSGRLAQTPDSDHLSPSCTSNDFPLNNGFSLLFYGTSLPLPITTCSQFQLPLPVPAAKPSPFRLVQTKSLIARFSAQQAIYSPLYGFRWHICSMLWHNIIRSWREAPIRNPDVLHSVVCAHSWSLGSTLQVHGVG